MATKRKSSSTIAGNVTPSAEKLRALAKFSGDPWQPKNKYFDQAEESMDYLWDKRIWPFISDSDFSRSVDLAAGKGRNSEKLAPIARELYIMDINVGLVDFCRDRFRDYKQTQYAVGNGFDLQPIPDRWATFVYCFDAMVHFDSDVVRSYIRDLTRVLAPGGRAFLHHSNLTSSGADWTKNPKARNFMSAELFKHYCEKEGITVLKQQIIDWGDAKNIDCLSLVEQSKK